MADDGVVGGLSLLRVSFQVIVILSLRFIFWGVDVAGVAGAVLVARGVSTGWEESEVGLRCLFWISMDVVLVVKKS